MRSAYFHGECVIVKAERVPEGAKKINPISGKYIIADSETTGNHHCVEDKVGVELFEKDGVLYLKNDVPVDVFCVIKERHDNETLQPGVWEIEPAQEYDYLTQETRKVAD